MPAELSCFSGLEKNFYKVEYIQVDRDTSLRTIHFMADRPACQASLIVVPGWLSPISCWKRVLPVYLGRMNVVLVETREKASARINGRSSFAFATFYQDLTCVLGVLSASHPHYALLGVSMGANMVLACYGQLSTKPACVLLAAPSRRMPVPAYTALFYLVPTWAVGLLRKGIRYYFHVFRKPDTSLAQRELFFATLDQANGHRAKLSALGMLHSRKLGSATVKAVDCPCLVLAATNDKFHSEAEARGIANELPVALFHAIGSFPRIYTAQMAGWQLRFLDSYKRVWPMLEF